MIIVILLYCKLLYTCQHTTEKRIKESKALAKQQRIEEQQRRRKFASRKYEATAYHHAPNLNAIPNMGYANVKVIKVPVDKDDNVGYSKDGSNSKYSNAMLLQTNEIIPIRNDNQHAPHSIPNLENINTHIKYNNNKLNLTNIYSNTNGGFGKQLKIIKPEIAMATVRRNNACRNDASPSTEVVNIHVGNLDASMAHSNTNGVHVAPSSCEVSSTKQKMSQRQSESSTQSQTHGSKQTHHDQMAQFEIFEQIATGSNTKPIDIASDDFTNMITITTKDNINISMSNNNNNNNIPVGSSQAQQVQAAQSEAPKPLNLQSFNSSSLATVESDSIATDTNTSPNKNTNICVNHHSDIIITKSVNYKNNNCNNNNNNNNNNNSGSNKNNNMNDQITIVDDAFYSTNDNHNRNKSSRSSLTSIGGIVGSWLNERFGNRSTSRRAFTEPIQQNNDNHNHDNNNINKSISKRVNKKSKRFSRFNRSNQSGLPQQDEIVSKFDISKQITIDEGPNGGDDRDDFSEYSDYSNQKYDITAFSMQ